MADDDTTYRQHGLDHAQAQWEPEIRQNGQADNIARKTVTAIERLAGLAHQSAPAAIGLIARRVDDAGSAVMISPCRSAVLSIRIRLPTRKSSGLRAERPSAMILCCGEALIDMIPEMTRSGAIGYVPHCGGSVFNTAIALGRLGAQVGLVSGLSTDFFSDQLRTSLSESGVDASFIITSPRPTTLAFVRLSEGQASYAFFDENTAGRMLHEESFGPIGDEVEAMFFGGISLVNEPCGQAYAALAKREAGRRTIMLDPNIRRNLIRDESAYRQRLNQLLSVADIVKVSNEDLDWLIDSAQAFAEKAQRLLTLGPAIVILTEGAKGATAYMRGHPPLFVPASRVEVVDCVGAGDTFNAGTLAELGERRFLAKAALRSVPAKILASAIETGTLAASISVSRAAANPPWAAELKALRSETEFSAAQAGKDRT